MEGRHTFFSKPSSTMPRKRRHEFSQDKHKQNKRRRVHDEEKSIPSYIFSLKDFTDLIESYIKKDTSLLALTNYLRGYTTITLEEVVCVLDNLVHQDNNASTLEEIIHIVLSHAIKRSFTHHQEVKFFSLILYNVTQHFATKTLPIAQDSYDVSRILLPLCSLFIDASLELKKPCGHIGFLLHSFSCLLKVPNCLIKEFLISNAQAILVATNKLYQLMTENKEMLVLDDISLGLVGFSRLLCDLSAYRDQEVTHCEEMSYAVTDSILKQLSSLSKRRVHAKNLREILESIADLIKEDLLILINEKYLDARERMLIIGAQFSLYNRIAYLMHKMIIECYNVFSCEELNADLAALNTLFELGMTVSIDIDDIKTILRNAWNNIENDPQTKCAIPTFMQLFALIMTQREQLNRRFFSSQEILSLTKKMFNKLNAAIQLFDLPKVSLLCRFLEMANQHYPSFDSQTGNFLPSLIQQKDQLIEKGNYRAFHGRFSDFAGGSRVFRRVFGIYEHGGTIEVSFDVETESRHVQYLRRVG